MSRMLDTPGTEMITDMQPEEPADAIVCDDCSVLHHDGQWYWGAPPRGPVEGGLCPACRQIRDHYPTGTIRVPADLITQRDHLLHLIRNADALESANHPLERLMDIDTRNSGLIVTTTGIHLARRIASKLGRALARKPRMQYSAGQLLVDVDFGT
jgi:hypothetical protein